MNAGGFSLFAGSFSPSVGRPIRRKLHLGSDHRGAGKLEGLLWMLVFLRFLSFVLSIFPSTLSPLARSNNVKEGFPFPRTLSLHPAVAVVNLLAMKKDLIPRLNQLKVS